MKHTPSASHQKNPNKSATPVLGRLIASLRADWFFVLLAFVCALVSVLLTLLAPILIGRAVDLMTAKGAVDFARLGKLVLLLLADIVGASAFSWGLALCNTHVAQKTAAHLRCQAFLTLSSLPLSSLDNRSRGDDVTRITADTEKLAEGLLQGTSSLFSGVVTVLGTLLFLLSIHWKIALTVFLLTPLSMGVAWIIAKYNHRYITKQAALQGQLGGLVQETVSGMEVVAAFGGQQRSRTAFDKVNQALNTAGLKAQILGALVNPSTRLINALVYAVITLVGALLVLENPLAFTVGSLSAVLAYVNQYAKPFNEISGVITELQSALSSARRVFALIDAPVQKETATNELPPVQGDVTFDHLYFSYTPDTSLLQNLSLDVKAGMRVAIVGPTGCGKTTLVNLLMRFYEPTGGQICLDTTPICQVTADSVRRQYAMVLQESWLFTGTVAENLAFAKENATRDEIVAAAKEAHAHSFIKKLPKGYDTMIAPGGENLSSGQKQLLCIARCMLTHPPMLILDEATSSIDTLTEHQVQAAFARMMTGRTSFVVAHRLSTIQSADLILVMEKGQVVETGTHDQLLAKNGKYARLYQSQFDKTESLS